MRADEKHEGAASAPSLVERLIAWPSRIFGVISGLLILTILILVIYSIVQRYVLNTPLKWGDEMLGYLLVASIMLGAAEALRRGDHIAIDLASARAGPRARKYLNVFSNLAVIAFAIVLGVSTWESVTFAYAFGSYSPGYLEVATWIPQIPMFVGALLLGLVSFARLLAAAIRYGRS